MSLTPWLLLINLFSFSVFVVGEIESSLELCLAESGLIKTTYKHPFSTVNEIHSYNRKSWHSLNTGTLSMSIIFCQVLFESVCNL